MDVCTNGGRSRLDRDGIERDGVRQRVDVAAPASAQQRVQEIAEESEQGAASVRRDVADAAAGTGSVPLPQQKTSILQYIRSEVTRSYQLENDEARYAERREKVYTFLKMPREVEKFMAYGFFQCADAFLFVFTFLPIRFVLAIWLLIISPCKRLRRATSSGRSDSERILKPAEICDILKGITLIASGFLMTYIDTSMMYHLIKSQSVIKLYIFFNMLEVADRLFSAFGQDLLDTLFWTATEPRERKREHFGVLAHLVLAILYVFIHTVLVLFQATTLNVAINSNNKALLTIMMSNNFVELKGSVFKKFEKNNLFQMSCSDVRERFHYLVLLLTVIIQTMKEYSWKDERFVVLLPDCLMVLFSEFLVDWVKHAFITRFNEIPLEVYKEYTISLAYDLACSKNKHAFSDHSDLVSRRMGFIPLPLGLLLFRILTQSVTVEGIFGVAIVLLAYICLVSFKLLNSIVLLGKACDLIEQHCSTKQQKRHHQPSKTGTIQRCNSHPPSRKTSTEALVLPTAVSKSVSHSRNPSFTGSLADASPALEDPPPMGPNPIFCNSTVSMDSLGINEALIDFCAVSGDARLDTDTLGRRSASMSTLDRRVDAAANT